jgi:hypothetical protein
LEGVAEELTKKTEIIVPPAIVNVSLETVENRLSMLQASFDILAARMAALKFEVPSTFKIDAMQMRALSSSQKGIVTTGGVMAARNVAVINVALDTANTEYTHTFGSNVVSWQLRVRDTDVPVLAAHMAGKLPTSGDGTAYFTVPAYYIQSNDGLDWSGKKLYLQTGSASQVAEIIEYRA